MSQHSASFPLLLLLLLVVVVLGPVVRGQDMTSLGRQDHLRDRVPYVVGGQDPSLGARSNCSTMAGDCRLLTYVDAKDGSTHMDVSCYCYFEQMDVTGYLDDLLNRPCSMVPRQGDTLDYTSFNITNCFVQRQPVPMRLLAALRRSRHMTLWLQDAPIVRLPLHQSDLLTGTLDTVLVTVINSSLSGIGRGLASGAKRLVFDARNSDLGVLGTAAFTLYDRDTGDVSVSITDSNITKFAKDSVDLPISGRMNLTRVRLTAVDTGAVNGSGELSLMECKVGVISNRAIDFSKMAKVELHRCTLALVQENALFSQLEASDPSGCHVIVTDTRLMAVTGSAFSELCRAAQVTWDGNFAVSVINGPLILEGPDCSLASSSILGASMISCDSCSVFQTITTQMCAVYASSWCSLCGPSPCSVALEDYVVNNCPQGLQIKNSLNTTCRSDKKMARRLNWDSSVHSPHSHDFWDSGYTTALTSEGSTTRLLVTPVLMCLLAAAVRALGFM